ncbi:MAG: HAD-IIB family hydrolase [Enterocloster asparagiformis]|nr:HAD-IIB family hydrolase [Enterocloster asparagiformis]
MGHRGDSVEKPEDGIMIKLIAVDLDGTLLDGENRIDGRNIRVLQRALDMGIYVVPATGRCMGVFPQELTGLTGLRYAVTENGALIWDYQGERELRRWGLPCGKAEQILRLAEGERAGAGGNPAHGRGFRVYAEVFVHGQAYADIRSLEGIEATPLGRNFIRYFTENHNFVSGLCAQQKLLDAAEKVNLYFPDSADGAGVRSRLEQDASIKIASSICGNVEVTAAGVEKGAALWELAQQLGIGRREILVFGDNENDLGMFAAAGTAVAMGNAGERVRQAAGHVTGTNDEAGVAAFLEKYVI